MRARQSVRAEISRTLPEAMEACMAMKPDDLPISFTSPTPLNALLASTCSGSGLLEEGSRPCNSTSSPGRQTPLGYFIRSRRRHLGPTLLLDCDKSARQKSLERQKSPKSGQEVLRQAPLQPGEPSAPPPQPSQSRNTCRSAQQRNTCVGGCARADGMA